MLVLWGTVHVKKMPLAEESPKIGPESIFEAFVGRESIFRAVSSQKVIVGKTEFAVIPPATGGSYTPLGDISSSLL